MLPFKITHLPRAKMARALGLVPPLPLSLTVSVTFDCDLKCLTCRVRSNTQASLTVSEYDKIFSSFKSRLTWLTLSGGEATLREDLAEIVRVIAKHVNPHVITLPTNGSDPKRVLNQVEKILAVHAGQLVVNLSLDGIGPEHDRLRGKVGCYSLALETLTALKALAKHEPRLTVGIHTVISRFSATHFSTTQDALLALAPDSYVAEVAEARAELSTLELDLGPDPVAFENALNHLIVRLRQSKPKGWAKVIQAWREEYYLGLKQYTHRPRCLWPCYAGNLSAQLMPDGSLWACCMREKCLGRLPEQDYDFGRVWQSLAARKIRQQIKSQKCHCTLANAAYTNMLVSSVTASKVALRLVRRHLTGNMFG